MADNLLIIGGTGFIGKHLTSAAVRSGFRTIVLSLHQTRGENKVKGAMYLQADTTDFNGLSNRLLNIDINYVINLSGYINHCFFSAGGDSVIDSHFSAVKNIVKVLDWAKLKRFIQIGSSDEYGNLQAPQNETMRESPISPYSFGKVASTQFLQMLNKTEGFPATILRLFLVYGPSQDHKRFLPQVIRGCASGKSFPTSSGEQLRDFCYVDDVTRGVLMALMQDNINGEVINIASGIPVTIRKVTETVKALIGQGNPLFGQIPYRTAENMALYADISKANNLLKWKPEITLEDGILRTINSYRTAN
ncbi:NAD-dependent epimerase/dehydratase family protein [Pseudomonadales bacterium]|nr:NAD-dependent epimerase/dehydratase family protein [Pseudomonadales bacterium]MDC0893255.1 NAD-dependent epimerase/dehydratase family protein [Pseudomonadales bacterium]